jgi:hypothetical protein
LLFRINLKLIAIYFFVSGKRICFNSHCVALLYRIYFFSEISGSCYVSLLVYLYT